MPVYNAAETLPAVLESIRIQTYGDFEIVAVDDGSDDASRDILLDWARRDGRLRPVTKTHRGLISTLNAGLNMCQGEFVARMDSDDLMHPERLMKQVALMDSNPEVSVAGCLVKTFARGQVGEGMQVYEAWLNGLVLHEDICRDIFIESPIVHPSAIVRREEILKLGGYQEKGWPEDYDLWLRYHTAGKRFEKVPEVLLYWREHEHRITHNLSRYSVENFLRAKAHYLAYGPLKQRDSLIVWGSGKTGRRLSKHLIRDGYIPEAFIDIQPRKIGSTLRRVPIIAPLDLPGIWGRLKKPLLVVAVASRGARALIREELERQHLSEGKDFICAA
jgi:glycosyltransferase involved in cell wall biosynthesis